MPTIRDLVRHAIPLPVRERIYHLRLPRGLNPAFSAYGEDLIVRGWLDVSGVRPKDVRYFDIGASHPSVLSNTYMLYRAGGSGVLVEPSPREAGLIRRQRPRDILVQAGIAFDERREALLLQFPDSVFNTFDEASALAMENKTEKWSRHQKVFARTTVPLVEANGLISQHFGSGVCHFLSIDAEGVDHLILDKIDFTTFRPWFICVERSSEMRKIEALLNTGYEIASVTPSNMLLAQRQSLNW